MPSDRSTLPKKPWRKSGRRLIGRRTAGRRTLGRRRPKIGLRPLRPNPRPPMRASFAAAGRGLAAAAAAVGGADANAAAGASARRAVSSRASGRASGIPAAVPAARRPDASATSDDAVGQLGPDAALDRGDRAERVLEVAARERAEVVGVEVVVGALAGADLLDLMLEAQRADERERL